MGYSHLAKRDPDRERTPCAQARGDDRDQRHRAHDLIMKAQDLGRTGHWLHPCGRGVRAEALCSGGSQPDIGARAIGGRGVNDGVGVDPEMSVQVFNGAGLAKMFDPERSHPVPGHRPQPRQRRGMTVKDGHDQTMARQIAEKALDMARPAGPTHPPPLRRRPAGIEPVRRGYRQHGHVTPVIADPARGFDCSRRDRALIGNDDLGVRPGRAQPIRPRRSHHGRTRPTSGCASVQADGWTVADRRRRRSRP